MYVEMQNLHSFISGKSFINSENVFLLRANEEKKMEYRNQLLDRGIIK